MSEAAAAPQTMPTRTVALTKSYPDGAPDETEEEKTKRLSELKARSMQPVKRDYVCKAPPKDSGSQRGQNKKRPIEKMEPKKDEVLRDPPGARDETSRIPFAAMLSLRKRERPFLTPRSTDNTTFDLQPVVK